MNYLAKPLYYKMYEDSSSILLEHFPFYAYLLQRFILIWTTDIKTAGVRIMPRGNIELLINPEFFALLADKERPGLLLHEILHIASKHLKRGIGLSDKDKGNRAMDTEINQVIPLSMLPMGALLPDNQSVPLPENEPFEVYYRLLPSEPKKDGKGGGKGEKGSGKPGEGQSEGPHVMDDHDIWDTGVTDTELVDKAIDEAIERAVEDTVRNRGAGHVPQNIKDMIEASKKKNQVPWYEVFHAFIGRKMTFNKSFTRKRPSRRLGLLSAGKTMAMGPKILFGTDVSGSVSDKAYSVLLAEAIYATQYFPEKVDMFFFDWEIFKDEVKLGDQKEIPKRPGHGGTNFEPVMQYALDKKPDLLIILTDGGAPAPTTDPQCPVLWVIVGGEDNPKLQGERIVLPENEDELAQVVRS